MKITLLLESVHYKRVRYSHVLLYTRDTSSKNLIIMPLVRLILDFILTYGMESIIVYTALLLKKRVIVYCPENQLPQLMSIVRYGIHFSVNFCLSFIPQFIHHFLSIYFYHPSIYSSIDSSIHWSIYLLIDWSIHWYIDSSIDWSIHPLIHPSLINSSIHPSISIRALL